MKCKLINGILLFCGSATFFAPFLSSCSNNNNLSNVNLNIWQDKYPEGIISNSTNIKKKSTYLFNFNLNLFTNKNLPPKMFLSFITPNDELLELSDCSAKLNNLNINSYTSYCGENYIQLDHALLSNDLLDIKLTFNNDANDVIFLFSSKKPNPKPKVYGVKLSGDDKEKVNISTDTAKTSENFVATLTAKDKKKIVNIKTVEIGDQLFVKFTYDSSTGKIIIDKKYIDNNITITPEVIDKELPEYFDVFLSGKDAEYVSIGETKAKTTENYTTKIVSLHPVYKTLIIDKVEVNGIINTDWKYNTDTSTFELKQSDIIGNIVITIHLN